MEPVDLTESEPVPTSDDEGVLDAIEFPRLAQLVLEQSDDRLAQELKRLLGGRFRRRAPRKRVKRTARLRHENYDEVVLLLDVSASGVRMLVPDKGPLDLSLAKQMTLQVKLDDRVHELPVAMVRVIGPKPKGIELACRFLNPEAENRDLAARLRSLIFAL